MNERMHNQRRRRAFSLVELLMAIFILGLGVIAISSLFPAGITQQRQANDDIIGSIVANNAISLLRSKVQQEDFGFFSQFGEDVPQDTVRFDGEWPWLRPSFIYGSGDYPDGTIDLFNGSGQAVADENSAGASNVASGIPYNTLKFGNTSPVFTVSQGERSYPMRSDLGTSRDRPQFYWDCMFRRFQGKVQVAIFVYRITLPPGDLSAYVVAPNGNVPPLPVILDLENAGVFCDEGPWDAPSAINEFPTIINGAAESTDYDVRDARYSWAEPGQWILDQNANIHRVLGQFEIESGRPLEVELQRPVPVVPDLAVNWFATTYDYDQPGSPNVVTDSVRNLYYVPAIDALERVLTPIFVLVEEL
ncbi:MAG: prepilin-type N-terminal cleavage/methylation domain-containing protein [Planctomycetota bacterium]|jgi:prepilin-type N-terminal cleavage/methylation domain-containing protein